MHAYTGAFTHHHFLSFSLVSCFSTASRSSSLFLSRVAARTHTHTHTHTHLCARDGGQRTACSVVSARMLFLARDGMRGQLVDVEAQTVLRNYAIGEVARSAVVFSPVSQCVVAHQARNCAVFLSAATQQPLQRSFTPELVTSCAVTRCGTFMVAGTANGTLLLWNLLSGNLIKNYKGHLRAVHCVALSADDSLVATASEDSVCKVWSLAALASLRMRDVVPRCVFTGHSLAVTCCTFLRHSSVLLTGSSDRTCRLVDTNTGEQLRSITVGDAVTAATVSQDDASIVAGTHKGFLFFCDLYDTSAALAGNAEARGAVREAILRPPSADGHHSPIVFLQSMPSAPSQVLTASEGGAVLSFDISSGRLVKECVSPQKGRLLGCCVVPRAALSVKAPCAPLEKNPIDPARGNYLVSQYVVTQRRHPNGEKRGRGSEAEAEKDGARDAALAEVRAKTEELRSLQAQLQRRLSRLPAAASP
ncbi:WD domain, G-beta repeat [Novymonas esmeraldas]|uniref:WD domain, G-beta repeat n=1 Tax=Novymonas esmeraldas TaxID=1808958 RepID=A0AAW0EY41_9TRYP